VAARRTRIDADLIPQCAQLHPLNRKAVYQVRPAFRGSDMAGDGRLTGLIYAPCRHYAGRAFLRLMAGDMAAKPLN